jgi:hypothetical protein
VKPETFVYRVARPCVTCDEPVEVHVDLRGEDKDWVQVVIWHRGYTQGGRHPRWADGVPVEDDIGADLGAAEMAIRHTLYQVLRQVGCEMYPSKGLQAGNPVASGVEPPS